MKLNFIKEQIESVDSWTSHLISDVDESQFGIVKNMGTSLNWQLGHIIISKYFHGINSIIEQNDSMILELSQKVPLKDLVNYYAAGSDPLAKWENRPSKKRLLTYRTEIDLVNSRVLERMSNERLMEKTAVQNPVAKNKYDALTFAFKHQMWHNGQIAMIKRIMN